MSSASILWLLVMTAVVTSVWGASDQCAGEQLMERVRACFTSTGLQLNTQPGGQDARALLRETQAVDPQTQCKHREMYKAAINCTLLTLRSCLERTHMEGAIPNVTSFHQGMDLVCHRKDELDLSCLKTQHPAIVDCGERTVKDLVDNSEEQADIEHIICLSAEVHYDCSRQYLKSCGKQTMDIYLLIMDRYQVPSACVKNSPGRPGRKPHNIISGTKALHSAPFSLISCLAALISLAILISLH